MSVVELARKPLVVAGVALLAAVSVAGCGGSQQGPVTATASSSSSPSGPVPSQPVPPASTSAELPRDPNAAAGTTTASPGPGAAPAPSVASSLPPSLPASPPSNQPPLPATGTASAPAPPSTASASQQTMMTVPVYWVRMSNNQAVLYREFRRVPATADIAVEAAVSAALAGTPADPDYRTLWRKPTHLQVTRRGDAIGIDLSRDAFANTSVGSALAAASIQQLVWTATAAAGTPGPVTITVDGQGYDAWGAVRIGVPMIRVTGQRAPIWIDYPTQGQNLPAGTVTITGSANVFEGHVELEVVSAATGKAVTSTFATAAMGSYQDFSATVTLPAGRYVLHAWSPDASGGQAPGGPRLFEVTTGFVVR
jgi:hypothetical protein